jgi:uncharacterized coiled-coil DUF342 family protein
MIGKVIHTNNISQDVSKFLTDKSNLIKKQSELNDKLTEINNEMSKLSDLKNEINELKNSCVNMDDINELINDIKNSFEMFVTNTPRDNINNELLERIDAIEKRLESMPNMEIIKQMQYVEPVQTKTLKDIPKLNIKRATKPL